MDQELYDVLESYKSAIDLLVAENDSLKQMIDSVSTRVDRLDNVLFDEILNPAKQFAEETADREAFNEFNNQYGETLKPYGEKLKALEGDDFDINRAAYDSWNEYNQSNENGVEQPDYVKALTESIDEQIEKIKSAVNSDPDAKVEITQENGETKIEVDDKDVTDEVTEANTEANTETEQTADEVTEIEETDNPDDVAEFEAELNKIMDSNGSK